MEPLVFTACTGRVVKDFYIRKTSDKPSLWEWAEQQGLPAGKRFDVITLSFGGNDLDFGGVIYDCLPGIAPWNFSHWHEVVTVGFLDDCDVSEQELRGRVEGLAKSTLRLDDGPPGGVERVKGKGSLADFYRLLAERHLTSRGRLVVVGYPRLFAPSGEWGLWQGTRCYGVTRGDANMLGRVVESLDTVLRSQVDRANDTLGTERVMLVSAVDLWGGRDQEGSRKSPAERHELCGSGQDWLNGWAATPTVTGGKVPLVLPRPHGSFHPNEHGHVGIATTVASQLAAIDWPTPEGEIRESKDVTVEQLRNVSVPSLCGHPAGRLVDGQLPGIHEGFVQLASTSLDRYPGPDVVVGDLDADGVDEGAVVLACNDGDNNQVLHSVRVYRSGSVEAGEVPFAQGEPLPQRTFPPAVLGLRFEGGQLLVRGSAYLEDDPHCCPSIVVVERYRLSGSTLTREEPRPLGTTITPEGLGPLRVGMTYEEVSAAANFPLSLDNLDNESHPDEAACAHVSFLGGPAGVVGLGGDGRLGSLVFFEASVHRTKEGIGVGSTEAAVEAAYRGRVRRIDNVYTDIDDAYVGAGPGEETFGLRFVFDDEMRKVLGIHAGRGSWIAAVEGCA